MSFAEYVHGRLLAANADALLLFEVVVSYLPDCCAMHGIVDKLAALAPGFEKLPTAYCAAHQIKTVEYQKNETIWKFEQRLSIYRYGQLRVSVSDFKTKRTIWTYHGAIYSLYDREISVVICHTARYITITSADGEISDKSRVKLVSAYPSYTKQFKFAEMEEPYKQTAIDFYNARDSVEQLREIAMRL